jgi:hypothetical protein
MRCALNHLVCVLSFDLVDDRFHSQAGDLCASFPADAIIRLTLSLLRDRVATVRQAALPSVAQIFSYLLRAEAEAAERLAAAGTSTPENADDANSSSAAASGETPEAATAQSVAVLEEQYAAATKAVQLWAEELAALATGKGYQERQLFARAAEFCWVGPHALPEAALRRHVLPLLLPLARDRVPNVRIIVARSLHFALTAKRMSLCLSLCQLNFFCYHSLFIEFAFFSESFFSLL